MTKTSLPKRPALFRRTQGPRAVDISLLVERGEKAAGRVEREFDLFAAERVGQIEAMIGGSARASRHEAGWDELFTAVLDLRTSSETVKHTGISSLCLALELLIQTRDRQDPKIATVMLLHCAALTLVVNSQLDMAQTERLLADLNKASASLPHAA